jgi:nitric oxide reductase subunit B
MTTDWERIGRLTGDPVSNVLKWILLAVAVVTFAMLGWMTGLTYKEAPPLPDRFVGADGTLVMSAADIQAGKAGFQKADLMDYSSLYGMGSYFGEDYTAANLVRLAELTEENIAKANNGKV